MKKYTIIITFILAIFSLNISDTTHAEEAAPVVFEDISYNYQFYSEITSLYFLNVISKDSINFQPSKFITRAEAAGWIAKTANLERKSSKSPYSDISITHPYAEEIIALYDAKLVSGYEDKTFRPQQTITRAEMAKMLANTFQLKTNDFSKMPFFDVGKSHWAHQYVKALYDNAVTKGYKAKEYGARMPISKGEMAALLYRSKVVPGNFTATLQKTDIPSAFELKVSYPIGMKVHIIRADKFNYAPFRTYKTFQPPVVGSPVPFFAKKYIEGKLISYTGSDYLYVVLVDQKGIVQDNLYLTPEGISEKIDGGGAYLDYEIQVDRLKSQIKVLKSVNDAYAYKGIYIDGEYKEVDSLPLIKEISSEGFTYGVFKLETSHQAVEITNSLDHMFPRSWTYDYYLDEALTDIHQAKNEPLAYKDLHPFNNWNDSISYLSKKGYSFGNEANEINPTKLVSKDELKLWGIEVFNVNSKDPLWDLLNNNRHDSTVRKYELALIMNNILKDKKMTLLSKPVELSDQNEIPVFAKKAVETMYGSQIVLNETYKSYEPFSYVDRKDVLSSFGQALKLLHNDFNPSLNLERFEPISTLKKKTESLELIKRSYRRTIETVDYLDLFAREAQTPYPVEELTISSSEYIQNMKNAIRDNISTFFFGAPQKEIIAVNGQPFSESEYVEAYWNTKTSYDFITNPLIKHNNDKNSFIINFVRSTSDIVTYQNNKISYLQLVEDPITLYENNVERDYKIDILNFFNQINGTKVNGNSVTIDGNLIQYEGDSNSLRINGKLITFTESIEEKNSGIYVPIRELADILNWEVSEPIGYGLFKNLYLSNRTLQFATN